MKKIYLAAMILGCLIGFAVEQMVSPDPASGATLRVCTIPEGCTSTSTRPNYGSVLVGNSGGTFDYVATSTFGGSGSGVSGGTAGMLAAFTSATALTATNSPTGGYFTATDTAATSTFAGFINTLVATGGYRIDGITILSGLDSIFSTIVGHGAAPLLTSGAGNTAIGYGALNVATTSPGNTAVGYQALLGSGAGTFSATGLNTAVGQWALASTTSGNTNVAVGYKAGRLLTTSSADVFLGYLAGGQSPVTGTNNIAIGASVASGLTTGAQNVFIGSSAGNTNDSGSDNVMIGFNVMSSGSFAPRVHEAILGSQAGNALNPSANDNTLLGYFSGHGLTTGNGNAFVGSLSGQTVTTGSGNILLGYNVAAPAVSTNLFLNIGNLLFGTLPATTTQTTAIAFGGLLGVSTTTPGATFAINGTSSQSVIPLFLVASSTGAATTTAFIIDKNGNTGVGTNTPTLSFSVAGQSYFGEPVGINAIPNKGAFGGNGILTIAGDSSNAAVLEMFRPISSGSSNVFSLTFGDTSNSVLGQLNARTDTSGSTGLLQFLTSDGTNDIERLRITSLGYLGVATTTPGGLFAINGTSTQTVVPLFLIASSTGVATNTALILDSSGRLGIGTNTPSTGFQLNVQGAVLFAGPATSTVQGGLKILTGGLTIGTMGTCGSTSALTTDSSGNVICGSITGGGAGTPPFTALTTYGTTSSGTSTSLQTAGAFYASSTVATSTFDGGLNLTGGGLTIKTAPSAILFTDSSGRVNVYGGASSCGSNNFFTGFSALGASSCGTASINATYSGMVSGSASAALGGTLAFTSPAWPWSTLTKSGTTTAATTTSLWTAGVLLSTSTTATSSFSNGLYLPGGGLTLAGIASQCLHTDGSGNITGSGADCATSQTFGYPFLSNSTSTLLKFAGGIKDPNSQVYGQVATFTVSTTTATGDYTDVQTAINALPAGGGKIHIRCGTYTLPTAASTSAGINIKAANTVIEGEGMCTQFNFLGTTTPNAVGFNATGLANVQLSNFYIHQTGNTLYGIGVNASNTPLLNLHDVKIDSTATATSQTDSVNTTFYNTFRNLDLRDNTSCVQVGSPTSNPVNDNYYNNIRCALHSGNKGAALYIDASTVNGSQNNTFVNFNSEPTGAATGLTALQLTTAIDTQFIAPYIEGNAVAYNIGANSQRTTFNGGEFVTNTTYTNAGANTQFLNIDREGVALNTLTASTSIGLISSNDASVPAFSIYGNTNWAQAGDSIFIHNVNSSDTGIPIHIVNEGSGNSLKIDDVSGDTSPFVLTATGAVGVGTSTPWRNFSTTGTVALSGLTANSAGNAVCISATTFDVENAGATACIASTLKAKHDISTISTSLADEIMSMRPVQYTLNGTNNEQRYGFIAEEVAQIDPKLVEYAQADATVPGIDGKPVTVKKGEPLTFDYMRYTGLLTAFVQQQQREIEALGGGAKRSAEENWQWYAIGLLGLGFLWQQRQIYKLKKK